ncbi:hypothetical protein [Streptomyces sp. NPDC002343]
MREIAHVPSAPDARAATGADGRDRGLAVIASASARQAVVTLGLPTCDTPLTVKGPGAAATSLAVTIGPDGGSARRIGRPLVQLTLKSVGFGE